MCKSVVSPPDSNNEFPEIRLVSRSLLDYKLSIHRASPQNLLSNKQIPMFQQPLCLFVRQLSRLSS